MKRLALVLLLAMGLCVGLAAPGAAQDKLKIGISIPTADHGWTGGINWWAKKAVAEYGAKYPNVEFMLVAADAPAKQIADLEDLMVKGINGLVILPHEPAPLIPTLKKVKEAGIFVVVVDRVLPDVPRDLYAAGDNPGFGRLCGEFLARELKGKGDIVVMGGIPSDVDTFRQDGFMEVIAKNPGIKILDNQPAMWSTQKGLEIMENYLQKYPKIDAVWCQDDDVLKGVLQAYRESGRKDIKLMLGGAGSKDIIKMIMDGDPLVRGTVTYPPKMIYDGVGMCVEHMVDKKEFKAQEIVPSDLVTKENASEFYYPDSIY